MTLTYVILAIGVLGLIGGSIMIYINRDITFPKHPKIAIG